MSKLYNVHMMKKNEYGNFVLLNSFNVEVELLTLLNQTRRYQHDGVMYDVDDICVSLSEQPSVIFLK